MTEEGFKIREPGSRGHILTNTLNRLCSCEDEMRLFFESALSMLKHTENKSHYYEAATPFQRCCKISAKFFLCLMEKETPGKHEII